MTTYRSKLPSDSEIRAATTEAALEKHFGYSHGMKDAWGINGEMHSYDGWAYFTLKNDNEIEVLHVYCSVIQTNGEREWHVENLNILRGLAHPEKAR